MKIVEEILVERVVAYNQRRYKYLMKWKGKGEEENSWEKKKDLKAFKYKIEQFIESHTTRASTAWVGENVKG